MASKRGGSTRKGKGSGEVLPPKPTKTIEIGPDFVGIKDESGRVLIDDTAYFRIQDEERPIWEKVRAHSRYEELHDAIRERLMKHGEDHNRDVGLRVHWLEQYMVGVCAAMLREAKEGKR